MANTGVFISVKIIFAFFWHRKSCIFETPHRVLHRGRGLPSIPHRFLHQNGIDRDPPKTYFFGIGAAF